MATMALRESSDMEKSMETDLDLEQENMADTLEHGKNSISSANIVDQRLISFYRLKRWRQDRKRRKSQSVDLRTLKQDEAFEESESSRSSAKDEKLGIQSHQRETSRVQPLGKMKT